MASPGSSRGYPVYFAKQPPKEIPAECPVCLHVLCQPKMVSCCGQSFCAICIGRVASDQKPCPLCVQQFSLTDNKWLERTLNGYDVYCPHQEKGCEWIGELGQLKHHLNQNPLPDKVLEGCQFQNIPCGLCQSYRCKRYLMADHVLNGCPNRDIECEYSSVGCDVKKPQQQLTVHMKEAASVHLSLFQTYMQNTLSEKENEINELKQELRQQQEQNTEKLREVQQQLTKQIQKIERKQSHAAQYWVLNWTLFIIILSGGIGTAYLYQAQLSESIAVINETMSSHSSRIEEIPNLIENELKGMMNNLLSVVEKISHDCNSTEKELKESIDGLSSEVENVCHDQHLIEKELTQAMNSFSSAIKKVNDSQYMIEKRLRESMDRLSLRISEGQHLVEEGRNESSLKIAEFQNELSDSVAWIQNTLNQLKSNTDTATTASEEVRKDVEQLKANMDSVEKRIATNSEEIRKLIVQAEKQLLSDSIKFLECSLKVTQDFFVGELTKCECSDGETHSISSEDHTLIDAINFILALPEKRKIGLQNRLAISLERNMCRAWKQG